VIGWGGSAVREARGGGGRAARYVNPEGGEKTNSIPERKGREE